MATARQIIRRLFDAGTALIALGEIAPHQLRLLAEGTTLGVFPHENGDASSHNIGVLYDACQISPRSYAVRSVPDGRETTYRRAIQFEITAKDVEEPIHVIVVHWHSHLREDARRIRAIHGRDVQNTIEAAARDGSPPYLVVLGDFNDEPFSQSMTEHLRGTRDRQLASRNPCLLYNPFWRHMGERHHSEFWGSGSYYYRKGDPSTGWYTYDQALVSSAFLQGGAWTLDETRTGIVHDGLITGTGAPPSDIDHLPIMVALSTTQEERGT